MESKVNTATAVDGLGNPIQVGDKVVWLAGTGAYGGVTIYVVRGITACKVAVSTPERLAKYPESRPTYADHNVVVVVNSLISEETEDA